MDGQKRSRGNPGNSQASIENKVEFARQVLEARKRSGHTRSAVARALAVSDRCVFMWEDVKEPRSPKPLLLAMLAQLFSVDVRPWLTLLGYPTDEKFIENLVEEANQSLLAGPGLKLTESDLETLLGVCRAIKRPLSLSLVKSILKYREVGDKP